MNSRRSLWLAVLTSIIISTIAIVLFHDRSYDDPYITYRYARNLVRGAGFVYNPGERVQSTTTPLFTLLLASLSIILGNLPRLANLIGAVSLAAGGLLLWSLAVTWKAPLVGWVGLLLYPLFPLAITPLGSETPFYIALCLGAFVAYARGHYRLTALCAALAVLTRPDGLLVGIILAVDFTIRYFRSSSPKPIPWTAILLFLGILLPWFIFAWAYFGSPLPATLVAKQQQGAMAISQRFASGFLTTISWYRSWWYILEAALALLGFIYILRRAQRWLLFISWPVLYFTAYSILGVSRYFWYYTPLLPGFFILAGLGLQAIVELPFRYPLRLKNRIPVYFWQSCGYPAFSPKSLGVLLLVILCLAQISVLPRLRQPASQYLMYRAAGEWLAAHTSTGAAVGALEVGILGYYARRPMVDFAGLIQPDVAARLAAGGNYEGAAVWAVEHYQPQYLALFRGEFPSLEKGYVALNCSLERTYKGRKFGFEKDLALFSCP